MNNMDVLIIRTNGMEEKHVTTSEDAFALMREQLRADTLETINLKDGRVMFIDEDGYEIALVERKVPGFDVALERAPVVAKKAINDKATQMYQSAPGAAAGAWPNHRIVGDVAIVWDKDFA